MLPVKTQLMRRIDAVSKTSISARCQEKVSERGLTLIESLVAITVIAVVITSFTPPIFLAVATRVQNRRAEQALQLAQGEVDRVRRIVETGTYADTALPAVGGANVRTVPAPSSSSGSVVDVNGDGTNDFLVQTYRSPGTQRDARTVAFDLGVRVYAMVAFEGSSNLESPPQRAASLKLTNALGEQKRRPLAIMYTTVVQSDNQNSLCTYHRFFTPGSNAGCQ